MKRKDLILLVAATVLIIGSVVLVANHYSKGSKAKVKPVVVQAVNPTFDTETVDRLQKFFSIRFDLHGLGRTDPFVGF